MAIIVILCGAPHLYKKDMNNSGLILFDMSDSLFLIGIHFQAMSTHPSM